MVMLCSTWAFLRLGDGWISGRLKRNGGVKMLSLEVVGLLGGLFGLLVFGMVRVRLAQRKGAESAAREIEPC